MGLNFSLDWFFIAILFLTGAYCMIVSRNLIKLLIGFEIISKASLIAVITAGFHTNNVNLAQAIIIVMILVEAVVIATGLALVVKAYRTTSSVDIKELISMKG